VAKPKTSPGIFRIILWSVVVLVISVAIVWMVAPPIPVSHTSLNDCLNNLREIDGAINEWAWEKNKTTNDTPTWDDLKPYLKLDAKGRMLKCPQGGVYTLWKVGAIPQVTCSLSAATPPHRLP